MKNKKDKELIFVKLGGAAITYKNRERTVNRKVLESVSKQISQVHNNKKLLIGHGGGSFPHFPASKYHVNEGIKFGGICGVVETQMAARELNEIVAQSLSHKNIPMLSVHPSSCALASNGKVKYMYTGTIKRLLDSNMVPLIYGDVLLDDKKGCCIASTEMIFQYLTKEFKPSKIIIGTDVDGVFSKDPKKGKGNFIPNINKSNIKEVLSLVKGTLVRDVTGGMKHKVQALYELGKTGADVYITNLKKEGNLKKAVLGKTVKCTKITY